MSPKNETQVGRFDGKCLYPLSQLAGPHFSEKSIFSSKHKMHLSSHSTGLWVGRTQVRMLQEKDWMQPHIVGRTGDAGRRWVCHKREAGCSLILGSKEDAAGYAMREAAAMNLNIGPLTTRSKPSL